MIINVLQRKIMNLNIENSLKNILVNPLHKNNKKFQGWNKTDILINISFKHIKICEKLINKNQCKQAQETIEFIQETISQVYLFEQSYAWMLLKVRMIVLKIHLLCMKSKLASEKIRLNGKQNSNSSHQIAMFSHQKKIKKMKNIYFDRVGAFCDEVIKNKHFSLLQTDWYSSIEVILFYGARNAFAKKDYEKCQALINKNRSVLQKQLLSLSDLLQKQDKKIFQIITCKCNILLKVYAIEISLYFAQNYQKIGNHDEQIRKVWTSYQETFNMVPNLINHQQIESIVRSIFAHNNIKESNYQMIFNILRNKRLHTTIHQKATSSSDSNNSLLRLGEKNANRSNLKKPSVINKSGDNRSEFKSRVKFLQDTKREILNIQNQSSQSESENEDQVSLPIQTKQYLKKLEQSNEQLMKNNKGRNRFLSIQYTPPIQFANKRPKSHRQIQQQPEQQESFQNDRSATIIKTQQYKMSAEEGLKKQKESGQKLSHLKNQKNMEQVEQNNNNNALKIFRIAKSKSQYQIRHKQNRENEDRKSYNIKLPKLSLNDLKPPHKKLRLKPEHSKNKMNLYMPFLQ